MNKEYTQREGRLTLTVQPSAKRIYTDCIPNGSCGTVYALPPAPDPIVTHVHLKWESSGANTVFIPARSYWMEYPVNGGMINGTDS